MMIVERMSVRIPSTMSVNVFFEEPFHSWKIHPHIVEKTMIEAMWRVHDEKPKPSGFEPPMRICPIE